MGPLSCSRSISTLGLLTLTSRRINWRICHFACCNMFSTDADTLSHSQTFKFKNQPNSWLFVSDSVAGAYGSQVNLNLDLKLKLACQQLKKLLLNIEKRNLNIDLYQLIADYASLQEMEAERNGIESQMSHLRSAAKTAAPETRDGLRADIKTLKSKLVDLQKSLWPLEEKVMHLALKLPNDVHPSTPTDDDFLVIEERKSERGDNFRSPSHVEIGKENGLIKFSNVGPKAYYLKGELAQAELSVGNTLVEAVQEQGYRLMAGPEFFKTPILEGCGRDVRDTDDVLTIQHFSPVVEPMNHLAGVSPMTFAAYLARTCVGDNSLPFRMMSCGRTYQPSDLPGLFGATQSTQVGVFSTTREQDLDSEFDAMYNLIWNTLQPLQFSLRACQIGVSNLRVEESRRVNFELYSPGLGQYVPVAHVSELGDYVSRRLMVSHNLNHGDYRQGSIAHMVSGSALNITSLLAIWMEHSYKSWDSFSLCPLTMKQSES